MRKSNTHAWNRQETAATIIQHSSQQIRKNGEENEDDYEHEKIEGEKQMLILRWLRVLWYIRRNYSSRRF